MSSRRGAPPRAAFGLAFAVALVATGAGVPYANASGLVATWRGLGSTPVVYGAEGAIVERIQGTRQAKDEYSRVLHSMDRERESAPYPLTAASSIDSLVKGGSFARRSVIDLTAGTYERYDVESHSLRKRTFSPAAVPALAPAPAADTAAAATPGAAAAADTSGAFAFVGDEPIAGFPARHYRSRTPQKGFLGFTIPDTLDLRSELVIDLWFAGPAPLLDRFFRERARFPQLTSVGDSAGAADTLVWSDGAELPTPDRTGALAGERGHAVAMDVSYRFVGSAADSIVEAYRARRARMGVVADLADRRVWLSRTRLLSLREEDAPEAAFARPPSGRFDAPAPKH